MNTKKYIKNKLKSRRRRHNRRKTMQRGGNPKVQIPKGEMPTPNGPPKPPM